jgi:predicted nucleotidyltransferase
MSFGLSDQALALIRSVLARHPEVKAARLFGSRALGTARPESDIDLALWGDIDDRLLSRILAELDALPLPYQFDVLRYERIEHPPLKEHIDRFGRDLGAI